MQIWPNNNKNLSMLWGIEGCINKLQQNQGSCPYFVVIDNGPTQCLVGNVHWVISKKYISGIGVDGHFCSISTMTLLFVDA